MILLDSSRTMPTQPCACSHSSNFSALPVPTMCRWRFIFSMIPIRV